MIPIGEQRQKYFVSESESKDPVTTSGNVSFLSLRTSDPVSSSNRVSLFDYAKTMTEATSQSTNQSESINTDVGRVRSNVISGANSLQSSTRSNLLRVGTPVTRTNQAKVTITGFL
jgi:hypothetical protein